MAITRRAVLAGTTTLFGAGAAHARDYPSRLIRIFSGFPAGGNVDSVARILAEGLERRLGQTVIVETKAGASGSLAAESVSRSAPDGHTLLAVANIHPMHAALSAHVRYNAVDDFSWISTATSFPYVICVRADLRFRTLRQMIDEARARPGTLNYGGGQFGTGLQMVVELIAHRNAVQFMRIPYRGENDAILALLAGEVEFVAATAGPVAARLAAGQLRALAVTGTARWKLLADVPTFAEAGVPEIDVTGWMGLAAPANLPKGVLDRLNSEMRALVALTAVRSRLEALGGEPRAVDSENMRTLVAREFSLWKQLGRDVGLKTD